MADDDLGKIGHPIHRENIDLTQQQKDLGIRTIDASRSDNRSPSDMMRQMGFDPNKNMNPLQFLIAVMNDDLELLFKNPKRRARYEGKGGLALNYRIEAAKTAAKYLHMQMPALIIAKNDEGSFRDALTQNLLDAEDRVSNKEYILSKVESISPDIPLEPASYPPDFIDHDPVNEDMDNDYFDDETEYNPDDES
jgi:hypothetical protein